MAISASNPMCTKAVFSFTPAKEEAFEIISSFKINVVLMHIHMVVPYAHVNRRQHLACNVAKLFAAGSGSAQVDRDVPIAISF